MNHKSISFVTMKLGIIFNFNLIKNDAVPPDKHDKFIEIHKIKAHMNS